MKNMNKKRLLFVIASLVFSLNSYAAERVVRQPLQQSQQSNTSSGSEPVMQTLPANVETAVQSGFVQDGTSNSNTESEPVMQVLPATVEAVIQESFVQDSTTNSTDSSGTEPAVMEMPVNIGTMLVAVSLAGRVIDPGGLSVADITVKAVQGDETLIAITDNNGNYQFALTQGVWSVFAADLDYDITPAQKVYAVEGYGISRIE